MQAPYRVLRRRRGVGPIHHTICSLIIFFHRTGTRWNSRGAPRPPYGRGSPVGVRDLMGRPNGKRACAAQRHADWVHQKALAGSRPALDGGPRDARGRAALELATMPGVVSRRLARASAIVILRARYRSFCGVQAMTTTLRRLAVVAALKDGQWVWAAGEAPQGPILVVANLDQQLGYVCHNGSADRLDDNQHRQGGLSTACSTRSEGAGSGYGLSAPMAAPQRVRRWLAEDLAVQRGNPARVREGKGPRLLNRRDCP